MTEAMPFLQKYDITFLRPPTIADGLFDRLVKSNYLAALAALKDSISSGTTLNRSPTIP